MDEYWIPRHPSDQWRPWLPIDHLDPLPTDLDWERLWKDITNRKIKVKEGTYTLRWGYQPSRSCTLIEAYKLAANWTDQQQQLLWIKTW
jgi:hypothetical protein